jgi:DNA-binding protein H-NS
MDSYQSLLGKISVLQKKASALRETEKKRVISEIRRLIDMYDVQPAEVFSDVKPRAGRPVSRSASLSTSPSVSAKGKQVRQSKPPKYRDPATGKTWNGHGKTPLWLGGVSDRTAYLIDAQAEAVSDAVKPKKNAQKAKSAPGRKPGAAKGTAKRAGRPKAAPQAEESADPVTVS